MYSKKMVQFWPDTKGNENKRINTVLLEEPSLLCTHILSSFFLFFLARQPVSLRASHTVQFFRYILTYFIILLRQKWFEWFYESWWILFGFQIRKIIHNGSAVVAAGIKLCIYKRKTRLKWYTQFPRACKSQHYCSSRKDWNGAC